MTNLTVLDRLQLLALIDGMMCGIQFIHPDANPYDYLDQNDLFEQWKQGYDYAIKHKSPLVQDSTDLVFTKIKDKGVVVYKPILSHSLKPGSGIPLSELTNTSDTCVIHN
jgi:hypothetical protein